MNRDVLDRWCELGILGLVLSILVTGPLALGAVGPVSFLVLQALTVGVMFLWAVRLWVNPHPRLLWPPICWAVVGFAVYAIARYLTCDVEFLGRQELIRVLVYAFLFLAILNNLHRQESTQIISFTLIFLGMAIAIYAIYQFLTGSDHVWHYVTPYKHRGSGTYISPNHLAGFLELLLPLALAYAMAGRAKPVTRIVLGYAALVLMGGIAVSVSRGGWIAALVALVLFFGILAFQRGHRLPALVVFAVLLVAGFVVLPRSEVFKVRLKQMVVEGKPNDDLRFAMWEPAFRMWQDYPWWGVGPDHFNARFRGYRPADVQLQPDRVHNDYLNTLVDWGLVGTALVVSAWALLAWGIVRTSPFIRKTPGDLGPRKGSNKFAFVLGASLALVAILIHSVVDFNMHIPANALIVVTFMALISSHLRFATERFWWRVGWGSKTAGTVVLGAGIAYLGWQGWHRASEQTWLARADGAPRQSPARIECLEKAFAANPTSAQTAYAIGEEYRLLGFEGGDDYQALTEKALRWFERATQLNPWDGYGFLRYGMCLDWLDRQSDADRYFARADALDPNGYYLQACVGLHYVKLGDYAAAKPWFERSLHLQWDDNPIASNYLQIVNAKLAEGATNQFRALLNSAK